jgi:hypothetical protein
MNRFAQHSVPDALKRMNRNRNQRKRKMNVKKIAIQEKMPGVYHEHFF